MTTTTPNPSSPTPAPVPTPVPAVVVPGFAITWPKILTVCATLFVVVGGAMGTMVGLVYGNIDKNITRIDGSVKELQTSMTTAARDAGSFQQLLNEAPDLKKNIQETHDAVLRQDGQLNNINSKLDGFTKTTEGIPATLSEIRVRLTNIENTIQRIPGLPK